MTLSPVAAVFCFAALCSASSFAAPRSPSALLNSDDPKAAVAGPLSSSALPDAPDPNLLSTKSAYGPKTRLRLHTNAFSGLAVAFTSGIGGLGLDVATPLATRMNLRASASFLNYSPVLVEQGIPIDGAVRFRSVGAGVDIYPYHNTFHITPGVTFYNGNKATATTNIVPGSTFTINDNAYISDPADPVHGVFDVSLGHKFAPTLTMGFGNMLRRESHWSVPVDFGFQYIGQPKFVLTMTGTVCQAGNGCTPIANDQSTQQDLAQQQLDINKDISPLRFYPILKVGISYRFGHNTNMSMWR